MIKGGCQSGRKVVPHDPKSDLPLGHTYAAVDEYINLRKIPHPNAKTAFFSSPYENARLMTPNSSPWPGRGKIFSLP